MSPRETEKAGGDYVPTPSEGEWRVGVSFNPSGNVRVDHIKMVTAALIDYTLRHGADDRTAAEAATAFETAAMYAVKSVTKHTRD
jgi:hypothetical protein